MLLDLLIEQPTTVRTAKVFRAVETVRENKGNIRTNTAVPTIFAVFAVFQQPESLNGVVDACGTVNDREVEKAPATRALA
jgi:hypothetical protein